FRRGPVEDGRVAGMDEATRRDRGGDGAEEQDADPAALGSKVAHADELLIGHAAPLSKSRAIAQASRLAPLARISATNDKQLVLKHFYRARKRAWKRPSARLRARSTIPARLESWPGARFLAIRIGIPAQAPDLRRSALARRTAGARWHSRCVAASSMQLSRFVVSYRDIRPGEHVLY